MPQRYVLKCFEDPEIGARLRQLSVTEHALMTYAVRCHDGMNRTKAFAMLIAGRHLTESDIDFLLHVTGLFCS